MESAILARPLPASRLLGRTGAVWFLALLILAPSGTTFAGRNTVSVDGTRLLLNDGDFTVIGLRCSNALISDGETAELIENLDGFAGYGVNTVSVFFMGSRFGDAKGYRPDASLDPVFAERMARIVEAADERGMVVLVGCLYWGNSRAKEDLGHWTQEDANRAVANTVRWLGENGYRNVIVDPDNEGMASAATGWDIGGMIAAAHEIDPSIVVGYNYRKDPPAIADILLHHSPGDGKRPYVESEGSPPDSPGGYWGSYSKEDGYYNYIRIGRYTEAMKKSQIEATKWHIENHNGYILASTWLQCAPSEGVDGPFMNPGGLAANPNIDKNVKILQEDAGILWWLEWVKREYGG